MQIITYSTVLWSAYTLLALCINIVRGRHNGWLIFGEIIIIQYFVINKYQIENSSKT